MFSGLKLYTVHTKSGSGDSWDKPVFLREGFNAYAFAFTLFWACYHRLWRLALVVIAANILLAVALRFGVFDQISALLVQLALQLMVGFCGNDVLRNRMQQQGYLFQDITSGDSQLRAEQRYFDRLVAHG